METKLIFDAKAKLGEGPAWDAATQTLYWVDILNKHIYAGNELLVELDELVGFAVPCKNGHLLVGKRFQFVDLDPATKQETILATLDSEISTNRLNDGKCDPAGRLIGGTMDMNETDPNGKLYSFDGKQTTPLLDKITISNGLAWSPDHKTFYYIDTPTREVKAFDYDLASGQIANPRAAIELGDTPGWPDGMTSDTDGNLWIAMWGGAQVTKWDPNRGKLLDQFAVPALHTSCPVFGGKDMNELYITSARKGMSEAELIEYPLSGGLFKIETNVTGMPTFTFG
jgi:sugar lactone lactonase YvrE